MHYTLFFHWPKRERDSLIHYLSIHTKLTSIVQTVCSTPINLAGGSVAWIFFRAGSRPHWHAATKRNATKNPYTKNNVVITTSLWCHHQIPVYQDILFHQDLINPISKTKKGVAYGRGHTNRHLPWIKWILLVVISLKKMLLW